MGDAANGKKLFLKLCSNCHTTEKGGKHKIGPNLFGVVGRKCGSKENYNYSDSMKKMNIEWSESKLDEYLLKPKQVIPGTKMVFPGMKKAEERRDVVAYLATLT